MGREWGWGLGSFIWLVLISFIVGCFVVFVICLENVKIGSFLGNEKN